MFILMALKLVIASAGRTLKQLSGLGIRVAVLSTFMFVAIITGLASQVGATELSDALDNANSNLTGTKGKTQALSLEVNEALKRYQLTNAGKCALLILGISSSSSVPVYFIPGPQAIAGLQFDILDGEGIKIVNAVGGADLAAMGKQISSAQITGGRRSLLIGLNQNVFSSGNIAILTFDTSTASKGSHNLILTNFVAVSPAGSVVPLCVTSGVITK